VAAAGVEHGAGVISEKAINPLYYGQSTTPRPGCSQEKKLRPKQNSVAFQNVL
jgi:hypothetical protein